MTSWQALLRDADPLRATDGSATLDAEAMRRTVVAAAATSTSPESDWLRSALALAATVAVMLTVGTWTGTRLGDPRGDVPRTSPAPGEVRQIQFATPGGTRIIWILNPDLNLHETTP
jgi:hypothetical protein